MPLNTTYLPKIDGLQTETSNINSDPRSLSDSLDVISNREDFLESRHGHPVCRLNNGGKADNSNTQSSLNLYAFKNETEKVYIATYKQTSGFRFVWISQTGEEIQVDSNYTEANITAYQITRSAQVNTNPVAYSHDQRLFFMTDNGLFYTKNTYEINPVVSPVKFPLIRTASIYPEWRASSNYASPLDAENAHWLVPGYQVNIKLVFEIEAKFTEDGQRRLESAPSRIYEIRQINPANTETRQRTSNMVVTIGDLSISSIPPSYRAYLKIYRTKQFKIGENALTEYYLAHPEITIDNTTIVNSTDQTTFIRLTANDDLIGYLEPLYNDTSQGGFGLTNHLPVPSKNVTAFRNYHIYSNISLPAIATIGLTQLPDENDTLKFKISRSDSVSDMFGTVTFTNSLTPSLGEVTIPSNAQTLTSVYISTDRDLSFRGLRSGLSNTTTDLNVRLRIVPGSDKGQVEPYGKITKVEFIQGTGTLNVTTVRVYPNSSGFDSARFEAPGFAAIVDSTGRIRVFFSYDAVQKNTTTTNYVDFTSSITEAAITPGTITDTLYVYYIPGEQIKTLPLYIGDSSRYLSLLPCKNQFEEAIAIPQITSTIAYNYAQLSVSLTGVAYVTSTTTVTLNFPAPHGLFNNESYLIVTGNAAVDGTYVISVTSSTQVTYSKSGSVGSGTLSGGSATSTTSDLLINPFYAGPLNKPFSKLLNDLAVGICDSLQSTMNASNEYISFRGGDLDQPGVIIAESLNADYEIISASKSSNYVTNKRNLSSYSISSNEVTITTSTAHPYLTGDKVTVISNVSTINGEYTITKLNGVTFKYTKVLPSQPSTSISGVSDKAKDCYEPPIITGDGSDWTILAKSEKASNAFIVSKLNRPEIVPVSSANLYNVSGPYSPARIGSPNKAIVACAATKDSVYMLKEDGVARVILGFNTTIPIIDTITVFDTTVFCNSAGSVQTIRDSVILLAQDGVYAIEGNDITKLSKPIETELKKAISQCKNNGYLEKVRSFANQAKNLYGVCIPLTSTTYVTYVLNIGTMRWVKWSNRFDGAVVDLDGRLTTVCTSYEQSIYANYIRQDRYTDSNPRNELDQYDDQYYLYNSTCSDNLNERTITQLANPSGDETIGNVYYRLRYWDNVSNTFKTKQAYYFDGTTYYKLSSITRLSGTQLKVTFNTTPPVFNSNHSIVVGVNMMVEFQPFSGGNPSSLKQFSGYHVHTEESVVDLGVQFRIESNVYTNIKTVSSTPSNRTVYRCFIPLPATRGRFLYRKVTHTKPYQICAIPAQAIIFRDTGSERIQKA